MTKYKPALLCIISAFLLMTVALYNGFPLTESDTGAYINQGFHLQLPEDRTPFYGIFLGITSLHLSLWLTVFAQSLILSFLLFRYIELLYKKPVPFRFGLICIISVVSFTCVAWVSAYLMPDVFAGILLLAILLFLSEEKGKRADLFLYAGIIWLAIIIHNSHFLITAIVSFVLLICSIFKKNKILIARSAALLGMSVFFWLFMCSVNAVKGHGFVFSRGGHVFMVTKFAESGILDTYLNDNCGKKDLKLCAYRGQIPVYSWDFLWDVQSPLYKTGGWDSNKVEFDMIIHDVFTTPKYALMFAETSAMSTLKELVQVQAPDKTSFMGKDTEPWKKINEHFYHESKEYARSKQNSDGLSATAYNYVYLFFLVLSCLWILWLYDVTFTRQLVFIYKFILLFLVVNAFVTATFSTVHYRFQYRVFWILPATNAILILRYYSLKCQSKPTGGLIDN